MRDIQRNNHKKKKRPTGTRADEVGKEWEFYHMMDFLKDFVRHRM